MTKITFYKDDESKIFFETFLLIFFVFVVLFQMFF